MKIKTITYKRTKNLGNYENEVLELGAELEESEDVEAAIANLQIMVLSHLGLKESVAELEQIRDNLQQEIRSLEAQVDLGRERWQKITGFLNRLGISQTQLSSDDIPF